MPTTVGGATQAVGADHVGPVWAGHASLIPTELRPTQSRPVHGIAAPDAAKNGIYVGLSAGSVFGYTYKNSDNGPAICTVYSDSNRNAVNDIAVDHKGNLMVPEGGTRSILLFKGPKMCGPSAGTISDPYGDDAAVASNNALTGTIAVGNIFGEGSGEPEPSISICTLSGGCTADLTNSNFLEELLGVAMDKNGNCWASGLESGAATLTYFAGCTGSGQTATGYQNELAGGLDVDSHGNLVSISGNGSSPSETSYAFVYSGCNPACKLVGGPFALEGASIYGHVNKKSTMFAVGDWQYGQVDVYSYKPKRITYLYSFNNGLSGYGEVYTAAYGPGS